MKTARQYAEQFYGHDKMPECETLIEPLLRDVISQAHRAGQEAMRERAVKEMSAFIAELELDGVRKVAFRSLLNTIRTLPITDERE